MKRQFNMYRRLIVIGMIMLMEFSLSSVWAFTQSSPSWRSSAPAAAGSSLPDYRFRSTSPLLDGGTLYSEGGYSSVTGGANYGPILKSVGDGEWPGDDDNPIGEIDDPAPVGDPFCLLLMATAYYVIFWRKYHFAG